ncbi:MAG TPA: PIG-L family deacetylase [Thermoanaerobaculia bacterium]|nr:PIG-L family deacetylase [Thermoanaerobaculia bacterium]
MIRGRPVSALLALTLLGSTPAARSQLGPPRVPALLPGVGSLLWIAAHPDDELLAAPLLARLCLEEGRRCSFLVLTRGGRGRCLLPGGCAPTLTAVRSAEMRRAARLFGASLTLWDLPDGGAAADGSASAWDAAAGGRAALLARLATFVLATAPDLVLAFDPRHGSTCHADHRAAGQLVVEALDTLPQRPLLYLLETRLLVNESPGSVHLRPAAPAAAGVFAFDANAVLGSTGRSAWQMLLDDLRLHRSQYDSQWLRALQAVPPRQRAVWLGPAAALLASDAVPSCP